MKKKQVEVNTAEDIRRLEWDYTESMIQHTCKAWFDATFPALAPLLFAAENGGFRTPKAAAVAKYEGMVNGAPDLVLFPTIYNSKAMGIEMKRPRKPSNREFGIRGRNPGTLSDEQVNWFTICNANGGEYRVCRGLIDFVNIICNHFGLDAGTYAEEAVKHYYNYR